MASSIDLISNQIDVSSIVNGLMNIERQPVTEMESQIKALQSKSSAYQSLNTKLSALSDKVNTLLYGSTEAPFLKPYSFSDRFDDSVFAKCSITTSNEEIVSATASNANVGGSYSLTVSKMAQAQSMASTGFADTTTTTLGTGTITIDTGTGDPVTITITSANNTLKGLQDAINNAHLGITASIVNDGSSSPYKLLLSSNETGTANAFTANSNLSGGPAFGFSQTQAAEDAQLVINGISITKSTNTIDDVISGVTFKLKNTSTGPVTLNVKNDEDSIVSSIKDLVTAYNAVNSYINTQFTYNSTAESAGVLAGDSTLRSVQSKLQQQLVQGITNRYTSLRVAGQAGLEFNRDGSLSLNETEFREALSKDFNSVAALFLGDGTEQGGSSATDSRVNYGEKTESTQAGTYAVTVTSLAQQASVTGNQILTSLTDNETLTITCGSASTTVDLLQDDTLSAILSKINGAFSAQGMAATATDDGTGRIKISTNGYGTEETLSIVSNQDNAAGTTGFGTNLIEAVGTDIAGTIGGNAAIGRGLALTGAAGQPEEGLNLTISQTKTGDYGTVTVASKTAGVEGKSILMNLASMLDGITDSLSGPIHNAMDGLSKNISSLNDSISDYEDRLDVRREMLTAEYNSANQALKLLQVTQGQLSASLGKS